MCVTCPVHVIILYMVADLCFGASYHLRNLCVTLYYSEAFVPAASYVPSHRTAARGNSETEIVGPQQFYSYHVFKLVKCH